MSIPRYVRQYRPLRSTGRVAARKAPDRRKVYALVSMRAQGRCELCGVSWERVTGQMLDPHHAYGRGRTAGIPAEFCDSPELVMGICRLCHDRIHSGDVVLTAEARLQALERFCTKHALVLAELIAEAGPDLVDVLRACCRRLEERTGG